MHENPHKHSRLKIVNIWVDPVNMRQALYRVHDFLERGDRLHTVLSANPEKSFLLRGDELLCRIFQNADLILPDGIGIVLAARILLGVRLTRVPGCELMQNICEMSACRGHSIFLFGAQEEVNEKAAQTLEERYPGLRIAGRCHGYVPEDEMDELIAKINESGAGILLLALGSPKQEKWIARYGSRLDKVRVCQGTGGTLDVIAGAVKRAPDAWCRIGLEWLYRLMNNPSRIKRQKALPAFAWRVFREKIRASL